MANETKGAWWIEDGQLHIDIPNLLINLGLLDNPENRDLAVMLAKEAATQVLPGVKTTIIDCPLCQQGDPSIPVRCWSCRVVFHLHKCQLDMVDEGTIIMGDCPGCKTVNCWVKQAGMVEYSGLVIYSGQPIHDLRGQR